MIVKTGRNLLIQNLYNDMINNSWYISFGTGTSIVQESDTNITDSDVDFKVSLSSTNTVLGPVSASNVYDYIKISTSINNTSTTTAKTITEIGIFKEESDSDLLFARVIQEPVIIGPSTTEEIEYYLYL